MATSKSKALPWVAVVIAPGRLSRARDGQWSGFVAPSRNEAIEKALEARSRWTRFGSVSTYDILVGRLEAKVEVPTQFDIVSLDGFEVVG